MSSPIYIKTIMIWNAKMVELFRRLAVWRQKRQLLKDFKERIFKAAVSGRSLTHVFIDENFTPEVKQYAVEVYTKKGFTVTNATFNNCVKVEWKTIDEPIPYK